MRCSSIAVHLTAPMPPQVISVQFLPSHVVATLPLCLDTCLVVDCGYSETSVLAVSHGAAILSSYASVGLGAQAIHKYVSQGACC